MLFKNCHRKSLTVFLMVFYLFSILFFVFPNNDVSALSLYLNVGDYNTESNALARVNQATWSLARDSENALSEDSGSGGIEASVSGGLYRVRRHFLYFDTSDIDNTATVLSVSLTVQYGSAGSSEKRMIIAKCDFHPTLELNDYNISNMTYEIGYKDFTGEGAGAVIISLDQNLTQIVNKTGVTMMCLMMFKDWYDIQPSTSTEYILMGYDNFVLQVEYTTGEFPEFEYCPTGDLTKTMAKSSFNYYYIETLYHIPISNTVRQVDLAVSNEQYGYQSDPSQYYVSINGQVYTGSNFSTINYNFEGYTLTEKMLSFENVNLQIDNKPINFAFGFKKSGSWAKWQNCITSYQEIQGDNVKTIKAHDQYQYFILSTYDGKLINYKDLAYRFWYDCFKQDLDDFVHDFDADTVFISPAQNGSLEFLTGDPINYLVYSHYWDYQPYIKINKDGSNIESIKMINPLETRIYTPLEAGSYNITLTRNNVWKAGKNFTVYGRDVDNYLYCIPAVSRPYENVRIYYNYTHGEGYLGKIIVSTSSHFYDTYRYITNYILEGNGSGYKIFQPENEGKYYIFLCVIYPNNNTYELYRIIHLCYLDRENSLTGKATVRLDSWENYQEFLYSHNFVSWDVVIKVNNVVIFHVGNSPSGSETWYPNKPMVDINSTLELVTDEGYICLDYFIFDVIETAIEKVEDQIENVIDEFFNEWQQFLLGLIIIGIAIFFPFFVARRMKIEHIPNVLYLFCGVVGFAICVRYGLFDIYTIILFTITFVGTIVWALLGQMGMLGGSTNIGSQEAKEKTSFRSRENAKEK